MKSSDHGCHKNEHPRATFYEMFSSLTAGAALCITQDWGPGLNRAHSQQKDCIMSLPTHSDSSDRLRRSHNTQWLLRVTIPLRVL